MDKDKRVSATCPICHEGELRRMDGPPEWYVLPAATLGLPDDEEKRVGRGVPVGISVCSRCPHAYVLVNSALSKHQLGATPLSRPMRRDDEPFMLFLDNL